MTALLQTAIRCTDLNLLKWLLDNNANIDAVDSDGRNIFHMVLNRSHENSRIFVETILEHETVDINHRDCEGKTPLFYVAEWQHVNNDDDYVNMIRFLISKGANIQVKDNMNRDFWMTLLGTPRLNYSRVKFFFFAC
jgi:ankyrin repeat protein